MWQYWVLWNMLKAVSRERHEYSQKTPMISKRSGIQLDIRAKIIRGKRMLLKYEFHVSLITFTFHPERFLFILVLPSPMCDSLDQGTPTFMAPGTGFMEDHFSMDGEVGSQGSGYRMIQAHCIYYVPYFYYCISSTSDHQKLGTP